MTSAFWRSALVLGAAWLAGATGAAGGESTWAAGAGSAPADVCTFTAQRPVPDVPPEGRGKTLNLSMGLQADCNPFGRGLDVVLVIDRPPPFAVENYDWDALHGTLETALRSLDLASKPSVRFGVVAASLETVAPARKAALTNNVEQIVAGINNVVPMTTSLETGVQEALRMLDAARSPDRPARQAILLMTAGSSAVSCEALRALASQVQSRGIVLITAWSLSTPGEPRCLADLASDVRFNLSAWGWLFLQPKLDELVNARGAFSPIQQVDLVDVLSDSLQYVGGGNPYKVGTGGNALEWHLAWPADGISLTYRARIVYCGSFRTSKQIGQTNLISGTVHFESHFWPDLVDRSIAFDNPLIFVRCDAVPTDTPTPKDGPTPIVTATVGITATVTFTPTRSLETPGVTRTATSVVVTPILSPTPTLDAASATPSAALATSTPEPTETPRIRRLYLPISHRASCATAGRAPLDVVLAVDVSGSMKAADVPGFPRRFEAAQAMGAAIVDHLAASDQIALLAFAAPSLGQDQPAFEWLAHLTAQHDVVRQALTRLPKRDGSRLDLALGAVADELASEAGRRREAQALVLLVTDGDLNQARRADVLTKAGELRGSGVDLAAVGVGIDADAELLEAVTGSRSRVFMTRDLGGGERLTGLVGYVVGCWRE